MGSLDARIADGSSRAGVLKVLRDRGDLVRVEDLAEAVNLSLSAVRFHLERLIADGLVRTAKEPRQTPGRPRVMYQAVPAEAVDDAAAYRRLAGLLAEQLGDRLGLAGGADAAERAGHAWAQQVVVHDEAHLRRAQALLTGRTGAPDSLGDVLVVLEDGGFSPRVSEDGWSVELHRCPFAELMPTQSDVVCSVHRGLVRSIPEVAGGRRDQVVLVPAPGVEHPCTVLFGRQ
jgi:predicted ArsR family transcriptional regulator